MGSNSVVAQDARPKKSDDKLLTKKNVSELESTSLPYMLAEH
jgi:hypothetical protein